ncbi:MAG: hypothetical protein AAFW68_06740 [Pseudomonadota bacterium]
MRVFLGLLIGLILAIGIAAGAVFVACDGDISSSCKRDGLRIEFDDHH